VVFISNYFVFGVRVKKFNFKFKEQDGSVKAEIIRAESIDEARAMAQAVCKMRKVMFLALNTVSE